MNFIGGDEFNLTEDVVCNIEKRFCKFYLEFVRNYFSCDKNFIWTPKKVPNHRTYKKKHDSRQAQELLLSCIQDTCMGFRKFYAFFIKYKEIAKYLSTKNPLVIYCVTGVSILAALGICMVIDKAAEVYRRLSTKKKTKIYLIVTERKRDWIYMWSDIAEKINLCYKNVKVEFVLFEEFSDRSFPGFYRRIKEADIVVMSRYLSRFEYLTVKPLFLEVSYIFVFSFTILLNTVSHKKSCRVT